MNKPLTLIPGGFNIELRQTGKTRFSVTYGQQVKADLNWQEAAVEVGNCLFHQLECDGKITRPDVGEAERRAHRPK